MERKALLGKNPLISCGDRGETPRADQHQTAGESNDRNLVFVFRREEREEKGARGQRPALLRWPGSGFRVKRPKGLKRCLVLPGSARFDASPWGPGCRNPCWPPQSLVCRGTVSTRSWRWDDDKDQRACGKEQEAGGRGDGDLFRNHGSDFASSQLKWCKLQFTQISEAWETSADDWVLYTWPRGVLGGRVAPEG